MEILSAGTRELYKMFSLNPDPELEIKTELKTDLTPEEEELVKYLKTGEWPTLSTAQSLLDIRPAKVDN